MSDATSGDPAPGPAPAPARPIDPRHVERLYPAWWIWLLVAGFAVSMALVVLPIDEVAAVTVGLATAGLAAGGLVASTPTLSVGSGVLRVGRATVPLALLGGATALDTTAMRHARGPGLDAGAFLCLRGWVPGGVRVEIHDPRDPTPYWLFSSRRPESLVEALLTAAG